MVLLKRMNRVEVFITVCIASWVAVFAPFMVQAAGQGLVINEVMASNATSIADEDGDFEDWIELYNAGGEAINLIGWGLSDDYGNPFRWVFPDILVQPGDFLLIWASGKNRSNPTNPLHANFSISQAGEEVLITRPDGTRQDELVPIPIPTDVSYGRKPDGADAWYYFSEPTPGSSNSSSGYEGIMEPPVFSSPGGIYKEAFDITISHHDEDAVIVYTLDGSMPCIENLDGTTYQYKNDYAFFAGTPMGEFLSASYLSRIYDGSITIEDRSAETDKLANMSSTVHPPYYFPVHPLFKGMVVRARAYREKMIPSTITTHSYFITPEGADRFSLPVISISIQEDMLFNYARGIYTPGIDADQWRIDHPEETYRWPFPGNYQRRGPEAEHPASFELFDELSGQQLLAQNIGLRIHGGATRAFPMKSFRIYARNAYGNSHLFYPFFENRPHSLYKRLILRNSGNDFPTDVDHWASYETMFRDAAIQGVVSHMNFATQAYQPAIVFLNGEYWGIQNIRERYDKYFLERVYGVDPDNIDIITGKDEPKEGDNLHYMATLSYIEEHGLQSEPHYNYIKTRIDVENFIDYQIANIYANNTDWPGNNIDFWRLRTNAYIPDSPYGHDGRWRWLLYDTDFGFSLRGGHQAYKFNTLAFATEEDGTGWPNPPWSTFLLRSFLENQEFRSSFINRFADQLNTGLSSERAERIILDKKNVIKDEIEEHFARWGYYYAYSKWENNVGVMLDFADNRPFYQRKHIEEFFDLDGQISVKLDTENRLKGHVCINTIHIHPETTGVDQYPYPWMGQYFKGVPVEIEAVPVPGFEFSRWEGSSTSTSPLITFDSMEDIAVKAFFSRTDEEVLIHYWHFDTSMPNDTPLEILPSFFSITPGGAEIEYVSSLEGYPYYPGHPNWRKASMERRNQPTAINYRPEGNNNVPYGNSNMRGLQIRQPFVDADRENTMILHLPTTGFSDIMVRFAAKDEDAADHLIIDYAVHGDDDNWINTGLEEHFLPLASWYQLYELDLTNVPGAANNPDLRLRIRFGGDNMTQDAGNRVTFNNISVDGVVLDAFNIYALAGSNGQISPSGNIPVHQHGSIDFRIAPNRNHRVADIVIDNESVIDLLAIEEDTLVYSFSNVRTDHHIHVTFVFDKVYLDEMGERLVIYPNPADQTLYVASRDAIESIEISNVAGRLIYSSDVPLVNDYAVNTGHLGNGIYIAIVRTTQGVVSRKFFVLR